MRPITFVTTSTSGPIEVWLLPLRFYSAVSYLDVKSALSLCVFSIITIEYVKNINFDLAIKSKLWVLFDLLLHSNYNHNHNDLFRGQH